MRSMKPNWLACVLAGSAAAQIPGIEAWDRFRGPNGSGVLDGIDLPQDFEHLLWRTPVPSGFSSPVLGDRFVYVTAHEGKALLTIAVDRESGAEAWRRRSPVDLVEPMGDVGNNPVSGTPATDGANVYAFVSNFGLLSYDGTGEERWRKELAPFRAPWGMGTSPIVAGASLLLQCDQDAGSYLLALDKTTGEELWRTQRPEISHGFASPVLRRGRGGATEILTASSQSFTAFDLDTGKQIWLLPGLAWQAKATPVLDGDRAYLTWNAAELSTFGLKSDPGAWESALSSQDANGDERLSNSELADPVLAALWVQLDLDSSGAIDAREWNLLRRRSATSNGLQALRFSATESAPGDAVAWTHKRSLPESASPLLYRGRLYCIKDGGLLSVLDAAEGRLLSSERMPGSEGAYFASPIASDGRIVLVDHGGVLSLLTADDAPRVLAQRTLPEPVVATPALGRGRVYVRSYRALYCFGKRG